MQSVEVLSLFLIELVKRLLLAIMSGGQNRMWKEWISSNSTTKSKTLVA